MPSVSIRFGSYHSQNSRRELESNSSSRTVLAVEIAVPLLAILCLLLSLLVVKIVYLQQRRIRDIHQVPMLEDDLKGQREIDQDSVKSPNLTINSSKSKHRESVGVNSRRASRSGYFVGLLGSPAWEANMQRHIADHHWRQHGGNHLHRHTWHPYPSTPLPSTPLPLKLYSPGWTSQRSPSIPSPRFDRFECPSMEEIQEAHLRRHHSLSITMTRAFAGDATAAREKKKMEGALDSWDSLSGTLCRKGRANVLKLSKDRYSQTPEITISVADDTNPQITSVLLPSNSFRLDSDLPAEYAKSRRNSSAVTSSHSHSSFLSLASTTHSKSSIDDLDLDENFAETVDLPNEAHLQT
ncbi:hypothetical protein SCHPADRAFT_311351 [Schizopora paradoxa]|uniref:Uncharacterized protein n=1 Tax=Schizopora paradoxa TaxID=27342 RepID=A0A0H2RRI6_9AGAM|nr:hypothetical protein SCHPADRAFT_311351 [Schizopora paradoxa]